MAAAGNYIVESDIDNWPIAVSATETFATTDVNITTDQITVTNDIPTATEIRFSSTGALPAPLVSGTIYYAIRIDATHIKVATNPVNAAAGTAIDLTDVGSGTHTLDIGSGSSQADRQAIIDRVEQLIESITRDFFYSKAFVIYRDGNGKDRLFPGLTPDILTISEIKISGVVLDSSWYAYNKVSVYLDPEAATASELSELTYRLRYAKNFFPKGNGNIKITGTYGWSSTPSAIKQAAIILASYENDSTLYTVHSGNFKREKIGDYEYELATTGTNVEKSLTGINEADRLIKNYVRKKPIMGAI